MKGLLIRKAMCFPRIAALLLGLVLSAIAEEQQSIVVAVGAAGAESYAKTFGEWAAHWQDAAKQAGARITTIGLQAEEQDSVEKLSTALAGEAKQSAEPLWIVLLGHGTATGGEAKFNLRGADVSVSRVLEWIKPFERPLVIVCGFSSSGAWMKPLSAPGRIIVTATRSGSEINFARFGGQLSKAIADPQADLDQDGQTSLLEAYIAGARATSAWYAQEGRLATEHALLDDNGDGAGTPADWFKGTRAVKKPREGMADGARAHQLHLVRSSDERALPPKERARRDELERQLAALREKKGEIAEDEYLKQIEAILLDLARLYRASAPK
jgi:hypothetical protein